MNASCAAEGHSLFGPAATGNSCGFHVQAEAIAEAIAEPHGEVRWLGWFRVD
jgi:hypothetical protein